MIRIWLPYIVEVANALEPLASVREGPFMQNVYTLYNAERILDAFLNQSVFSPGIRSSRLLGDALLNVLRAENAKPDNGRQLLQFEAFQISSAYGQFKTALMAELGVQPSYFVSPKQGYDTLALLDNGLALFPAALPVKVPEAVFDLNEAGKAMAFELGTACGFHLFRGVESVVRRYYGELTGGAAKPKQRNLGVYIRALEDCEADAKIIAALRQLKDLHRNPIAHPEVAIGVEEAGTLVGMARSVIAMMLDALPNAPTTTLTAGQ
jgi:hypothetical protein